MALKLVLFVSVMVSALALPIAKAQLFPNTPIGAGVVLQVQPSFVPCSLGANVTDNPGFPNAQVQLQCGAGIVVASATTNASGIFSLTVDLPRVVLLATVRLSNCNLVVTTPLSTCNSTLLNVGVLESGGIQFIGFNVSLGSIVLTFRPVGFRYISLT